MTAFASLVRRADTMLRVEGDQIKAEWWRGYIRGLHCDDGKARIWIVKDENAAD